MLGFITKKRIVNILLTNPLSSTKPLINFNAFLYSTALNSSTPVQPDPKGDAFTITYLTESCGVAADAAKRIANYFQLKSEDKPSRALSFFKSCGFDDAQISFIVRVAPQLLLADPDKSLKPKFDLFASLGVPHDVSLKIISKCPRILTSSVENKMVPMFNCLKSLGGSEEEVLSLLAGSSQTLIKTPVNVLEQNVALLRRVGMPDSNIWRFVAVSGYYSTQTSPDRFKVSVDRALAMGFDLKKQKFGHAVTSFATVPDNKWDRKLSIFKKWGWSDKEFLVAFKKQPRIMVVSEEKIERLMEYLVKTMGIEASIIAGFPIIFKYSLEKRIIPRCSVLQVLISKGLTRKNEYCISTVVHFTDENFLLTFVEKWEEIQDELMSVYSRLRLNPVTEPASYA